METTDFNEQARLQALNNYNILDTLPEEDFDALTKLASYICNTPIALISLLDAERQWFKSRIGLAVPQTGRDIAFCKYTIAGKDILEITDTHQSPLVKDNPLVTGEPNIRFYAGAPLTTPAGHTIGTLCVIDTVPRQLTAEQKTALQTLAREVVSHLELRAGKQKLELENQKLEKYHMWFNYTKELMCVIDVSSLYFEEVNHSFKTILGYEPEEVPGKPIGSLIYEPDLQNTIKAARVAQHTSLEVFEFENRMICKDGSLRWFSWNAIARNGKWYADGRDITESKKLKTVLHDTQEMANVGGWELDLSTKQLLWTEQMYYIHELPPGQPVCFLDAITYYHPDYILLMSEAVDKAVTSHEAYDLELLLITAKGTHKWVRAIGKAVFEHTRVAKLRGTIQDITFRKKAEAKQQRLLGQLRKSNRELHQKEKYLKEINKLAAWLIKQSEKENMVWQVPARIIKELGLSSCSIFLLNDKKQYLVRKATYTSAGVEKYYKNSDKIPVGEGLIGEVAKTGIAAIVNDVSKDARFKNTNRKFLSKLAVPVTADGTILGVISSTHSRVNFFNAQHQDLLSTIASLVASSIKNAIHLHQKMATEQALRESEEQTRLIIDTALDGVIITSSEGIITDWNKQATHIFGWTKQEAVNKSLTQLIVPEAYRDAHQQALLRYVATRESRVLNRRIEVTALKSNGQLFPLELTISPIHTNSGIRFSAFVRDITEQKNIQRELLDARIKAEESSKAKEIFIANMSHEIRTPMNAIIGMANLIASTALTAKQTSYLDAIQSSARNLLVIINDILDFSKIESGKLVLETIGFRLEDMVSSLIHSNSYKADEKGIVLSAEIDSRIHPVIKGDPFRLNQVLLNLVNNAIKFTSQGYVELQCFLVSENAGGQLISFKVIDTGIGISQEKLGAIYDSFIQEDASITRRFGGTGLGLSISKQIVELMGGKMKVESEKAKGSIFSFEVLFPKGAETDIELAREEKKNVTLQGVKVLLVEDHEINRFLAVSILQEWNVILDIAENGLVAVKKMKSGTYDIILMDVQMPVMSGIEATEIIRNKLQSAVPIIALTANASSTDSRKCIEAGMNDYISKPFNPTQLFNKIASLLRIEEKQAETSIDTFISVNEQLFDLAKLYNMANGNTTFVNNMVTIFKQKTPQTLSQINDHFSNNRLDKVALLAHQLKPSIDFMGIRALTAEIRLLEKCHEEHITQVQDCIHKLNTILTKVFTQLNN